MILGPSELRAAGVPEPWSFGVAGAVRFGEIDALGHVNNTAYLRWFEEARARLFVDLGVTDYGEGSPRLVLRRIEAEFLAEMRLHEPYVVTVRAARIGTTSVAQDYGVFAPDLRATGRAVTVFMRDGAKVPVPEAARAAMRERDPEGR